MANLCSRLLKAVNGLKALVSGFGFVLLALGDYLDVIPIRPLMEHYLGVEQTTPVVLCWAVLISSIRYALGRKKEFDRTDAMDDPDAHNSSEPF